MGAQNTKVGSTVGHLNVQETAELRKVFAKISGFLSAEGIEKNTVCSYNNFQGHCEKYLDDWLAKKIADKLVVRTKASALVINLADFLGFVSTILKGTWDEKFSFVWELLIEEKKFGQCDEKQFHADEIHKYVRSIIESYFICVQAFPATKSWSNAVPITSDFVSDLALYVLQELFHKNLDQKKLINLDVNDPKNLKEDDGTPKKFNLDEVVKTLSKNGLFLKIHDSVFSECFSFEVSTYFARDIIPYCIGVQTALTPTDFTLLDLTKVVFLNSLLPLDFKLKWRHLFSTTQHGESFSKMLGLIQDKGPTLLIIRDEKKRIFGAFAPQSWSLSPKFYGNEQAFLFHLFPRLITYFPTGYNNYYQYLNIQQKTLPNGIGFGGTFEYFGLWIDAEFGKGKCSPSCTTYQSCPQLSANPEFTIDHLEVWGVGEQPKKPEGERDQSILDKDPEAKALLEMMGKHGASDGHRDKPDDE